MKVMPCPLNGPRPIQEFSCGGEVVAPPDPDQADAEAWADYLFLHDNAAGIVREWWYHVPTRFWFIADRDTVTDEIVRTFLPRELFGPDARPDQP